MRQSILFYSLPAKEININVLIKSAISQTGHEECTHQTRRAVVNRLERSISIDVSVTRRRRATMRGQPYAHADLYSSILLLGERHASGYIDTRGKQ